ncbi:hypothetical protein C6Y14_01280 [Streptomyces dioscori]|uniref:Uncharacterized protein n=1 Tax=Streptomyces dioscori TaxID=2109333 RepID=A0A2P8QF18_9ACTN|nr:hypothetical protein [Streptomyces dioscori]PSM44788.1 hypothetical protein C6Y14_01280 [Streptomyces dioscori]
MNAAPEPGEFDSIVNALRVVMREQEENLREIDRMSEVSFRLWLNSVAGRIAKAAGVSLARMHAYLGDLTTILTNARSTLRRSYHDEYRRARRVPPTSAG